MISPVIGCGCGGLTRVKRRVSGRVEFSCIACGELVAGMVTEIMGESWLRSRLRSLVEYVK